MVQCLLNSIHKRARRDTVSVRYPTIHPSRRPAIANGSAYRAAHSMNERMNEQTNQRSSEKRMQTSRRACPCDLPWKILHLAENDKFCQHVNHQHLCSSDAGFTAIRNHYTSHSQYAWITRVLSLPLSLSFSLFLARSLLSASFSSPLLLWRAFKIDGVATFIFIWYTRWWKRWLRQKHFFFLE